MRLKEIIKNVAPLDNYKDYLKPSSSINMPDLNIDYLSLERIIIPSRKIIRSIALEGDVGLILSYKGKEGVMTSIQENDNGNVWDIRVVSGAKTSKSFRVASSMHWQKYFGNVIKEYSEHADAEVNYITMPYFHDLINITDARSQMVGESYNQMRDFLKMKWSDENRCYIRDVLKKK